MDSNPKGTVDKEKVDFLSDGMGDKRCLLSGRWLFATAFAFTIATTFAFATTVAFTRAVVVAAVTEMGSELLQAHATAFIGIEPCEDPGNRVGVPLRQAGDRADGGELFDA